MVDIVTRLHAEQLRDWDSIRGRNKSLLYFPQRHTRFWGSTQSPMALELDIYSLAHHLCKMRIFYEPRSVTLGNTRHFVEE